MELDQLIGKYVFRKKFSSFINLLVVCIVLREKKRESFGFLRDVCVIG